MPGGLVQVLLREPEVGLGVLMLDVGMDCWILFFCLFLLVIIGGMGDMLVLDCYVYEDVEGFQEILGI